MLKLDIVTPYGEFCSMEIDRIIATGIEGDFAILPNRIPVTTPLKISVCRILKDDKEDELTIGGGYLSFIDNHVIIVANSAEWFEDIDIKRAEASLERAKKRLESKREDIDIKRAELSMKRALNRINCKG